MNEVAQNLEAVRVRMAAAADAAKRDSGSVTLIAVGKMHPPEKIREAVECGCTDFGENRVQEMLVKAAVLPQSLRWHLIGHLQTNKIRKALHVACLIHSVDSMELARDIDRIAAEEGLHPKVLLEVNVGGEGTKFGFKPEQLPEHLDALLGLQRVCVEGLMAIPPPVEDPEDSRPYFAALRHLRDRCEEISGTPLPVLSMGMTHDFEVAIAEGATHVRIGTAIFGSRSRK